MLLEDFLRLEKDRVESLETLIELIKNNNMFNNALKRYLIPGNDKENTFIMLKGDEVNNIYVSKMNDLSRDGKYKRIKKLRNELLIKINSSLTDRKDFNELMYSVDTFYECEVYGKYEKFANFCKERGYTRVFDIGSAFGLQSEVFLNEGLSYVGINDLPLDFWNKDIFEYIVEAYPMKIKAREADLAISSLCLTWDCYLFDKENTLIKQCEALSRDFKSCLLYMQMDKLDTVNKYFANYEIIEENMVYFYN